MNDLQDMLGEELLSYLLAGQAVGLNEADLSEPQKDVVSALRQITGQIQDQHPIQRTVGLANGLLHYFDDRKMTLANACRVQCGGNLPEIPESTDVVLSSLLRLGRDTYPGFLLPRSDDDTWPIHMTIGGGVFGHPEQLTFCQAVLADEQLGRLFPGAASDLDLTDLGVRAAVQSRLIFASGRGTTFQLVGLADTLLTTGYYRALLDGPTTPESYLACLKVALQDVRKIATRQQCDVPAIIGFANIEWPPGTSTDVSAGRLSPVAEVSKQLLPPAEIVSVVLITTTPIRLLSVEPATPVPAEQHPFPRFSEFATEMAKWAAEVNRPAELMRLAFLLASPDEGLYAVRQVGRTILDPLAHSLNIQWSTDSPFAPSPIAGLRSDAVERVREWADKTKDHPKRLDIAMRRTLSAAVERADPHDGFIDAVLAWENMFSGRPETNLRVCGAIAWLLEPESYEKRSALFKETKDLYNKRSGLVHGSIEAVAEVFSCRDRAVRISLEAMKRLYGDADLLQIKDSADRGGVVLMGRFANVGGENDIG